MSTNFDRIKRIDISVTATGGAGTSTGTATTVRNVNGEIKYIDVQYTAAPASTDINISCSDPYNDQILGIVNSNARFYGPVADMMYTNAGIPVPGAHVSFPQVRGTITVDVAGANNGTVVNVAVYYI